VHRRVQAAYSFVIGENNFVYPMMSGHNTICVVTALLETGMVPMESVTI
jgi:proline racemase